MEAVAVAFMLPANPVLADVIQTPVTVTTFVGDDGNTDTIYDFQNQYGDWCSIAITNLDSTDLKNPPTVTYAGCS
jgi:hypothetical protein